MKRYKIRSTPENTEFLDILNDQGDEFVVRFTRDKNGSIKTTEEKMTKQLFNLCLQTGFIKSMAESAVA